MNRIEQLIAKIRIKLATKGIEQEKIDKADVEMKLDVMAHADFQNIKNLAMLSGKINQEEAQTIYAYLGECVSVFNGQPLAVRVSLMTVLAELVEWRIAQKIKEDQQNAVPPTVIKVKKG